MQVRIQETPLADNVVVSILIMQLLKNGLQDISRSHHLLSKIRKLTKHRNIKIEYRDHTGSLKMVFLNNHSMDELRDVLIYRGNIEETESKITEYMKDILINPLYDLEIFEYEYVRDNTTGKCMAYINNSDYDLKRYQIYKHDDIPSSEHCLIYTLKQAGVDTSTIDNFVVDGYFKSRDLGLIADKLLINIQLYNNMNSKPLYYPKDKKYSQTVKIALYHKHYFIYEKTGIHLKLNKRSVEVTSIKLIDYLMLAGHLGSFKNTRCESITNTQPNLSSIMHEQSKYVYQPKKYHKPRIISYGDIECITSPHHIPFMYARYSVDGYRIFTEDGDNKWKSFKRFLSSFPKGYNIVYFHNLKYDWNVIKQCPYINIISVLEKDGLYYKILFKFFATHTFELRDSYKLIPKKLSEFPKAFSLTNITKHEFILYELYSSENIKNDYVRYRQYNGQSVDKFFDVGDQGYITIEQPKHSYENYIIIDERIVVNKLILSKCAEYYNEDKYYHIAHCRYYIQKDCKLLKLGVEKFRENMINIIGIDCYEHLTLSSMVHEKVCSQNFYEDVYEVSDNLLMFILQAVAGGRVCTKDNKKWDVKGKIYNIDGKSLYPSAIYRISKECGFPTGPAKVIANWDDHHRFTYYIVKVIITKVTINQQIPFMSYLENGLRNYTNDMMGRTVVIDKLTLEDWVKFHGITYEFVEGIYWEGIGNNKIGEFIYDLYQMRRKYIQEDNNVMNEICKLTLNSLYGKTLLKVNKTKVVKNNDKSDIFIYNNFNQLINQEKLANQSIFTINNNGIGHKNMAHIGGMILSMARRIMNEVMSLANQLNIHLLYQDTDSMHVVDNLSSDRLYCDKLSLLEDEYARLYNRKLIGEELGQFGHEFKYPGHNNIYSTRSIILGKKAYMDVVGGINTKNGNFETFERVRMKGINSFAMNEYANNYTQLYQRLLDGEKITFDLAYGNGVVFKFDNVVTTRDCFLRQIEYAGECYQL